MNELDRVFADGQAACSAGKSLIDNPYGDRSETPVAEAWKRGFLGRHQAFMLDLKSSQPAAASLLAARLDPTLPHRLGWMADAMVSAKLGPTGRFFSRERVDEIVLLLREAEKALVNGR